MEHEGNNTLHHKEEESNIENVEEQPNEDTSDDEEIEDLVYSNEIVLNALTDLLIQKGLITEDELDKKVEELYSEEDLGEDE